MTAGRRALRGDAMQRLIGRAAAIIVVLMLAAWLAWAETPSRPPAGYRSLAARSSSSQTTKGQRGTSIAPASLRKSLGAEFFHRTGFRASARKRQAPVFLFRGARSCGAIACHGDVDAPEYPREAWRRSYLTWAEHDPHAQAHVKLEGALGVAMMQRLGILDENCELQDPAGYANCAGCHNPTPAPEQRRPSYFVWDGVGCEHCHGPSDAWAAVHHTAGWDQASLAGLGMTQTQDLTVRASVCTDCHIGAPGREVNHDLIAAGHPRLKFEFGAFLDLLPKHWDANGERIAYTNFELQAWLAGQAASAQASLELLKDRAERAEHGRAVWPEFAEYDCFACHHDLEPPGWRQERNLGGRDLGSPSWGSWYYPLFERAAATARRGARPELDAALDELRRTMQASIVSDQAEVRRQAQAALDAHRFLARSPSEVLDSLAAPDDNTPDGWSRLDDELTSDWDLAAQVYLAFVAIDRAYHDERQKRRREWTALDRRLTDDLERLRCMLAYPADYVGPRNLAPSPKESDISGKTEILPAPTRNDAAPLMNTIFVRLKQRIASAASFRVRP